MSDPSQSTTTESVNEFDIRLQKCQSLQETGANPFVHSFSRTHPINHILTTYASLEIGEDSDESFTIAGRLMAKRGHGKATFGNIMDESGAIQYYANINGLGDDVYQQLLSLDVGDIIGITGSPFRSKRGELSLRLSSFTLLTKSLHPLPEKFHGLQDKELRYRQRYVDLIVNPEVKKTFQQRSSIISSIRSFLTEQNFMEVETPVLQNQYGGASARPFITHHNELSQDLYLRISLELYLKRLIVGGFEKVYEIGRVFRNEGISFKHNPEYTLLELYQAFADYHDMMSLTETLLSKLVYDAYGTHEIDYQGTSLNFSTPFKRITFSDALLEFANISIDASLADLQKKAKELGFDQDGASSSSQLINFIYDKAVEPQLVQPTFILDHPWETSPLAKRHRDNPKLVERFECIIANMEIANAFTELNDPIDQESRFDDQARAREAGDLEAQEKDEDFLTALRYGMPPTGGLGIGIDRIVMLLTNTASIRDVLFFPHMKTKSI